MNANYLIRLFFGVRTRRDADVEKYPLQGDVSELGVDNLLPYDFAWIGSSS